MKRLKGFACGFMSATMLFTGMLGGTELSSSAEYVYDYNSDYDIEYDNEYSYDSDGNGSKETTLTFSINPNKHNAKIIDIETDIEFVKIPETIKVKYFDYNGYEDKSESFTVTELDTYVGDDIFVDGYGYDDYDYDYYTEPTYKSIEIPYTVTKITDKSIGYHYEEYKEPVYYEYYDWELDEYVQEIGYYDEGING